MKRAEYVLDHEGWDDNARRAACREVAGLLASSATDAGTDIPWSRRHEWPAEVVQAAARLRDRFVPGTERAASYMLTGLQRLDDEQSRRDFTDFVPYAYDAALFVGEDELMALADEGTSWVASLTHNEWETLERIIGTGCVVPLRLYRERPPSPLRRLARRLAGR